ncbi:MAG: histidine ammonia-lyase [Bacteroidales bacterium]
MPTHHISSDKIDFDLIRRVIGNEVQLVLSDSARDKVNDCRRYLDERIERQEEPIYGVTTGFGSLCNHNISESDLSILQKNLVMSHACGVGDEVPESIVRLMLFLKIQALAYGHSGIRMQTLERLIAFYNHGIYPVVYTQGSLGASGDLAPLAHLSLPLLGLGELNHQGTKYPAADLLEQKGWAPLDLAAKEGLALLNGTQFMGAYGAYALVRANELSLWADLVSAISLEAYMGRIEPFFEQVHRVRNHQGQLDTAANIRKMLEGSELMLEKRNYVQDPYSFRCIPQVHGAGKDVIDHVSGVFRREMNAVTDNPTLFPDDDLIISAGNFHGQPLAISLDYLGIALAELGSISERRIYRLISGARDLPSFLVARPGLNSGFMIPQYTAASVVSQNKQLCTPASVDSIESSQGQEDHVSMGANAAVKTLLILDNLEKVLAIELMTACQALEFRDTSKTSPVIYHLLNAFREKVSFVKNDRLMYEDIHAAKAFICANTPGSFMNR